MNRKSFIAAALGASFVLATLLPTSASAYPPGTDLQLAASTSVIDWDNASEPVGLSLTNAGSTKVAVYVNGKKKFGAYPTNGTLSWQFSPGATGRFVITGVVGGVRKTVTVYRPTRPIIYSAIKTTRAFWLRTKFAAPGTPVTVVINGVPSSKIRVTAVNSGGFGSVYIPGSLLRRGSNTVTFHLGNLSYTQDVTGLR